MNISKDRMEEIKELAEEFVNNFTSPAEEKELGISRAIETLQDLYE